MKRQQLYWLAQSSWWWCTLLAASGEPD